MDRIFEAVLAGAKQTAAVLRADPLAATKRATRDVLIDSIPHWLYVGDTSLHLAAAALRLACAEVSSEPASTRTRRIVAGQRRFITPVTSGLSLAGAGHLRRISPP